MAEFGDDPRAQVVPSEEEISAAQTRSDAIAALARLNTQSRSAERTYGIGAFPPYGRFYGMHYSSGYFVGEDLVMVDRFEGTTYDGRTTPASETFKGPKYDLSLTIGKLDDTGEFQTPFGDKVTPSFVFGVNTKGVFVTQYSIQDGKLVAGPELLLDMTPRVIQDLAGTMEVGARTRPQVDMHRRPVS